MLDEINGCIFLGEHGLFKIFCVFEVLCIQDIKHIRQGDWVKVVAVKSTIDGTIVYEIDGEYYFYYYFVLPSL
jgi:hypothetical protein